MSLEGVVVHVSLDPGPSSSKCIVSFAVGPPVLVEFSSDSARQLPAFIMGTDPPLQAAWPLQHWHLQLCTACKCVCSGIVGVLMMSFLIPTSQTWLCWGKFGRLAELQHTHIHSLRILTRQVCISMWLIHGSIWGLVRNDISAMHCTHVDPPQAAANVLYHS